MKRQVLNFIIAVFAFIPVVISVVGCGEKTVPTSSGSNQYVVCLDPGHPSENNPGTAVQNGLREVDINWQVGQRLKELLEKTPQIRVVMTKDWLEQEVDNKTRAIIANQKNANLSVRLHCDSGNGRCQGITFYYPDRQGTKDGKTGPSADVIVKSREAANIIHSKTVAKLAGALKDNGVKGESLTFIGSQQGALTGSIYSEVPVVTVEMVFLDNPSDAEFIGNESGQQIVAEALKEGVLAYLAM